ncbi:MAG: hypothetical protein AAFQ24_01610 [Pseudomonadota bacterium]
MKLFFAILLGFIAGCSAEQPEPSAQEKYDEIIQAVDDVKTGTEFSDRAESMGHDCRRTACSLSCRENAAEGEVSFDETLTCAWDETASKYSKVTFGTVFSVVYLKDDQIVRQKIEIIYTGP